MEFLKVFFLGFDWCWRCSLFDIIKNVFEFSWWTRFKFFLRKLWILWFAIFIRFFIRIWFHRYFFLAIIFTTIISFKWMPSCIINIIDRYLLIYFSIIFYLNMSWKYSIWYFLSNRWRLLKFGTLLNYCWHLFSICFSIILS